MLITGGLGFIGLNLMRRVDATLMDIKDGYDCTQAHCWNALYRGGPIIHLAAESGVPQSIQDPKKSFWTNVVGTYMGLEMARENKARFIFASSSAADNKQSPYGASKAAGEAYCQAFGACYDLSYACLRFANVYGPYSDNKTSVIHQMIKDAIYKKEITVHGDGYQKRDFVFVEDVCDLITSFTETDEAGVFDVCTGIQTSVNEVAQMISNMLNVPVKHTEQREDVTDPPLGMRSRPVMTELEEGIEKTLEYYGA